MSTTTRSYRLHVARRLERLTQQVDSFERLLTASDPERVLARGYGLVYGPEGRLVRSVDDVAPGDMLKTRLAQGTVTSTVTKKEY